MNEKVRVKSIFKIRNELGGLKKMKFYLRALENESIRALIKNSNSMNSEGGLAKGINPSEV